MVVDGVGRLQTARQRLELAPSRLTSEQEKEEHAAFEKLLVGLELTKEQNRNPFTLRLSLTIGSPDDSGWHGVLDHSSMPRSLLQF